MNKNNNLSISTDGGSSIKSGTGDIFNYQLAKAENAARRDCRRLFVFFSFGDWATWLLTVDGGENGGDCDSI